MVIYKKTFENTKTSNCNFPIEDQIYTNDCEAIVADGITRDPIGVDDLSTYSYDEMLKRYPRPSGGELAAKQIVKTFSQTTGTLKERLILCNEQIKRLNDQYVKVCDYLQNDYFGAVASCARLENDILHYAFICDCGVIVYDKFGHIKFQTEDEKELYSDPYIRKIGIPWNLKEARVITRRDYRNNLDNIKDGKCVSYGALTGEVSAVAFIKEGSVEVEKEDTIVVYSDGFTSFLHDQTFIEYLLHFNEIQFEDYIEQISKTDYEKYGKEKTLVILKNNI